MARDDFLAYLNAWEERAKELGAEKVTSRDLTSVQFAVSIHQDQSVDMLHISMGPSRRAAGGGIWCDGWTLLFATESHHNPGAVEVRPLLSLSAFRDEFNTVSRRATASP